MKVVVVEDTVAIADMLAMALEFADVEVIKVTSDFASLLTPEPWRGVDAAVIDLMLPDVDGESIVRYLAAEHPSLERVVLSAVAHQREGLADLATCLSKPVDPADLLNALGVRRDT
jgi:DNA-binding response OmpR family regulator